MTRFYVVVLILALFGTLSSFAGTKKTRQQSSTQALTYAAQAIAALTGGNTISDVTLSGTATWTAGSTTDSGSITFLASGTAESRMDIALSSGTLTEIRDAQTGTTLGKWIKPDGSSGLFAFPNCQTDAVWFFPALGSLTAGPNVVLSYIGLETRNGESVQHLRSYVVSASAASVFGISMQSLSTMDLYLDATTFLPSAITFNAHPDTNAPANIPVEIDFSNYQAQSGIQVPMNVQKYFYGSLLIDVNLITASFNTGISLSNFSVN